MKIKNKLKIIAGFLLFICIGSVYCASSSEYRASNSEPHTQENLFTPEEGRRIYEAFLQGGDELKGIEIKKLYESGLLEAEKYNVYVISYGSPPIVYFKYGRFGHFFVFNDGSSCKIKLPHGPSGGLLRSLRGVFFKSFDSSQTYPIPQNLIPETIKRIKELDDSKYSPLMTSLSKILSTAGLISHLQICPEALVAASPLKIERVEESDGVFLLQARILNASFEKKQYQCTCTIKINEQDGEITFSDLEEVGEGMHLVFSYTPEEVKTRSKSRSLSTTRKGTEDGQGQPKSQSTSKRNKSRSVSKGREGPIPPAGSASLASGSKPGVTEFPTHPPLADPVHIAMSPELQGRFNEMERPDDSPMDISLDPQPYLPILPPPGYHFTQIQQLDTHRVNGDKQNLD